MNVEKEIMECELNYQEAYSLLKRLQRHFGSMAPKATPFYKTDVQPNRDAARYRWLNKQHNLLIYVEDEKQTRTNLRLRCGPPLDTWIDNRIDAERTDDENGHVLIEIG